MGFTGSEHPGRKKGRMNIEIDQNANAVEIRLGQSTYLLTQDAYEALAAGIHANPPANVVWRSRLTTDMVSHLSKEDRDYLIQDLDEAVERYSYEYKVN